MNKALYGTLARIVLLGFWTYLRERLEIGKLGEPRDAASSGVHVSMYVCVHILELRRA